MNLSVLLYGSFCCILLASLVVILTPIFRSRDFTLRQRYLMAGSVFVFFFAAMFAVYYAVGAPEVVELTAEQEQRMLQLRHNITVMSQRVKQDPADAEAWVSLGQSYLQTGQYKGAVNALKKAVKLTGGNPEVLLAYVDAQITEAQGRVTDDAKKGLEMVLLQEPENPYAKYWLAVRLLQEGKTEDAMKMMREMYYKLPDDSPVKLMIDEQIGAK